ncbi:hypothetical protein AB7M33_004705 [Pseudomonas sp. Y3 TE3536]
MSSMIDTLDLRRCITSSYGSEQQPTASERQEELGAPYSAFSEVSNCI